MSENKKLNKNFIINFIQNWIIAVCENFDDAVYAWEKWASWILLVKWRWGEFDDVFIMPDEDLIREVLDKVDIPIFVRVKFWHFWEAKICEELWADGILESCQNANSLDKKLNEEDFKFPIISEIFDTEKILDLNENILILWDYATGNFNSIKEKFSKIEKKISKQEKIFFYEKNIFLWWWISSVADLEILKNIWKISGFFIWSAIFDLDSREFFEDYWEYKKNIFDKI